MEKFMRKAILCSGIVMLMAVALARGDVPATAPSDAGFTLSTPRVAHLAPCTYFYTSVETTYDKMNTVVPQMASDISIAMQNAGIAQTGAPILVYKGAGADPGKPFTLEFGFPVSNATQPVGLYQVAKLDSVKSMTAVYCGPVSKISEAYRQIFAQIMASGEAPSDERRERYLYWEGHDSPNNVILIEIGLRESL
jgi:effector-binding domain-containing protein